MNKYSLAKLVQWAGPGGISGRKRLQKVVYFLQHAGCSFDAEYTLHHYGPYSQDVAMACDELVCSGVLQEESGSNGMGGRQYTYRLSDNAGPKAIQLTESGSQSRVSDVQQHEQRAQHLLGLDLWELELGSTILYFFDKLRDWDEATKQACDFKKCDINAASSLAARKLAQDFHNPRTADA